MELKFIELVVFRIFPKRLWPVSKLGSCISTICILCLLHVQNTMHLGNGFRSDDGRLSHTTAGQASPGQVVKLGSIQEVFLFLFPSLFTRNQNSRTGRGSTCCPMRNDCFHCKTYSVAKTFSYDLLWCALMSTPFTDLRRQDRSQYHSRSSQRDVLHLYSAAGH